ncbi:type II and III secretion system protein family protein [Falsiroseomonas sp. E2-1-a4]|uniref:type II and III secretion system protein family protein n=1 Tax=Falsiroseomonas sp. E2-1-a4 TaxID=3239299 RepID=UPI003F5938A7
MTREVAPTIPITLSAGTGRLLRLPGAATSVITAEPRIVRVEPTSPTSLFLMAVAPGRTTVVATAEDGSAVAEYEVTVTPGAFEQTGDRTPAPSAGAVESAIRRTLRGSDSVRVAAAGRNGFVLSGTVANAADAQRAEMVARVLAGDERTVVNNLQLLSAIQVNVRVRIAEVSRQVTRELGLNWRAFGQTGSFLMGLRSGPAALSVAGAVLSGGSSLVTSPSRVGLGLTGNNYDINAVIDALAADQLISILAEPNLTAQSGETASFLAGGEFPIPIAATSTGQITIEFKQFGVSLAFVPTVMGPDRVNLRIRPEVSELTDQGAVTVPLGGTGTTVTIPALAVRRAETTVELGSGQSFAIAGLLQRNSRQSGSGVSGIGEVPILGALFRSDRFQRNETELVIIVTPYLVRPVSEPGALGAPTDGFRPATDIDRVLFQRQIARGSNAPQLRGRPDAGFILE